MTNEPIPFYQQSNESNSSRVNISQIGFNNLRKFDSHTSITSTITTNSSSTKTNPLAKLFTKNKSQTSISIPQQAHVALSRRNTDTDSVLFYDNDDSLLTIFTQDSKATTNSTTKATTTTTRRFRLARPKLRFNKSSGSNKPDLTIQTKKIVTAPLTSDSSSSYNRKNSISSPTFHGFFHRTHTDTSLDIPDDTTTKLLGSTRTALCLSSNNSNSYVTNVEFASIFKFTDPNFQIDDSVQVTTSASTGGDGGSSSLADIHRKLLVPTDLFFQTRIQRHHSRSQSNSDESQIETFRIKNTQFYNQLFQLLKPLFMPSINKNNRLMHPYLGVSLEEIGEFIRLNFFSKEIDHTLSPEKQPKSKSKTPISATSSAVSLSNDNFSYFKAREITQDLLMFFSKCINIFKTDYLGEIIINNNDQSNAELIQPWVQVAEYWKYFNEKIRFYILVIFHRFQINFNELSSSSSTSSSIHYENIPTIDVESILLFAFRETIIIPILLERSQRQTPSTTIDHDERVLLQDNYESWNLILDCLAALLTSAVLDSAGGGGSGGTSSEAEPLLRNDMVMATFNWLSNIF